MLLAPLTAVSQPSAKRPGESNPIDLGRAYRFHQVYELQESLSLLILSDQNQLTPVSSSAFFEHTNVLGDCDQNLGELKKRIEELATQMT